MIAPILLSVAAMIAGKPVDIACDADTNLIPNTSITFAVEAWTYIGGDQIHLLPQLCQDASQPIGTYEFAHGVGTIIHEATHARGIARESCAELTADIGIYDILRRLYGIPFFSKVSLRVGAQVLALSRARPPDYQPEGCWNTSPS